MGNLSLVLEEKILSLGFLPVKRRLCQFAAGFMVTALLCVAAQALEMLLKSSELHPNGDSSLTLVLKMLRWDFISVLTEEMIFRGALLYVLLKRLGAEKGVLLSAIAFGGYHWVSFGIFGKAIPMFFVSMGT